MRSVFTYEKLEESNLKNILEMQGKSSCRTQAIATVFLFIPVCLRKHRKIVMRKGRSKTPNPQNPPKLNQLRKDNLLPV